jgi:hypothetical protein
VRVPSSSDVLPDAAQARFTAAEGQLYPLALVDPDEYEQVTRVVGLLAAELRTEAPDIATVLGLREELVARVPMIAAEAGLTIGGFPRETIADAASAIRCRELQAARSATRWADRLEAARSTGEEWVDEEPDAQAAWAGSYRSTAVHVPTGTRLIGAIEAGSAGAPATYTIEIIVAETDEAAGQSSGYPDRDSWLAALRRLRAEISSRRL